MQETEKLTSSLIAHIISEIDNEFSDAPVRSIFAAGFSIAATIIAQLIKNGDTDVAMNLISSCVPIVERFMEDIKNVQNI